MQNATVIEDVIMGPSGMPVQTFQNPQPNQPEHIAYGLQLPQPLKQTQSVATSYQAPSNTMRGFNHYQQDSIGSSAFQSSAIRGRVVSPHVYQWDAAPQLQQQRDYRAESGMIQAAKPVQFSRSLDPIAILREAVAKVYGNASMLKTKEVGQFSVYNCPVENMTSGPFKYIVAIVPNHQYVQLGSYFSLASLPWVSFQTRTTENPASVFGGTRPAAITYNLPRDNSDPL